MRFCCHVRSTRVQCPPGIYSVTGLRLTDDNNYPKPDSSNHLDTQCRTMSGQKPCITTMHDG